MNFMKDTILSILGWNKTVYADNRTNLKDGGKMACLV